MRLLIALMLLSPASASAQSCYNRASSYGFAKGYNSGYGGQYVGQYTAGYGGYQVAKPYYDNNYSVAPYYPPKVEVVNTVIPIGVPVAYDKPLSLQGSTYYGYTTVGQTFGSADPTYLFDKVERVALAVNDGVKGATGSLYSLTSQRLKEQKELAETQAVGQVAREIIKSIGDANVARILAQSRKDTLQLNITQSGGKLPVAPPPGSGGDVGATQDEIIQSSCIQCHKDWTGVRWEAMDQDLKDEIYDRVTTSDLSLRMPRAPGGKVAGEPLSLQARRLLAK